MLYAHTTWSGSSHRSHTNFTMAAYIRVSPTLAAVDWVEATLVAQMIHGDVRRVQQARAKTMCVNA